MTRRSVDDLLSFIEVARELSFTRAAAKLGVSPSALSHSMRGLEERLGVRLLTRSTRSVTLTVAGARLLESIGPRLDEINAELASLGELRYKPAGIIRVTVDEHGFNSALWPALRTMLRNYPDIKVEVAIENGFTDIVAQRFDAGVRLGGSVAKDMIAMPIGPPLRMVTVAAPVYLKGKPLPRKPQDLTEHTCINLRLSTRGGIYAWEFAKRGRELRVRVDGQFIVNGIAPMLVATLDGFGVGYLPLDLVQPHVDTGQLVQLLSDWTPPFAGYHLYYASRRQPTAAFKVLLEALRYPRAALSQSGPTTRSPLRVPGRMCQPGLRVKVNP
jgi:DNA-binding transcriptional LysR family regulator